MTLGDPNEPFLRASSNVSNVVNTTLVNVAVSAVNETCGKMGLPKRW